MAIGGGIVKEIQSEEYKILSTQEKHRETRTMKPFHRYREVEARAPRRKPTGISELFDQISPLLFFCLFLPIHSFSENIRVNEKEKTNDYKKTISMHCHYKSYDIGVYQNQTKWNLRERRLCFSMCKTRSFIMSSRDS